MISILAFLFVFGILVFIHEFGHFILAKRNGVRIEKFSFGFGRKIWGKKIGDTEYLLSAIPLGGYIKMAGDEPGDKLKGASDEFLSKSCGKRAQVIAAGPVLNYLLAFVLFFTIFLMGSPTLVNKVGELLPDYPAEQAGIKPDDVILAVDGEKVEYWDDLAGIIHRNTKHKQMVLDVKRESELLKIKLTPQVEEQQNIFGQKRSVGLIGISPAGEVTVVKYGLPEAFIGGGKKLLQLTAITYKSLWLVITRQLSFKESFAGPILIFKLTGNAAEMGFIYLLNLMAILSMSLAIFNFLPIPVLDGGHILFLVLEKLRKKPVRVKTQEIATQVGILFLVSLLVVVSYNDLMRSGWIETAVQFWSKIKTGQ
ncbi:MAG: RIP metalloprotease RseP [Candidatus Omnitrophica bacterium]|nr:RIP metalloprotease RseP [Candidatus Omnitrophota bacterium]